jgi:hypothetical protein
METGYKGRIGQEMARRNGTEVEKRYGGAESPYFATIFGKSEFILVLIRSQMLYPLSYGRFAPKGSPSLHGVKQPHDPPCKAFSPHKHLPIRPDIPTP